MSLWEAGATRGKVVWAEVKLKQGCCGTNHEGHVECGLTEWLLVGWFIIAIPLHYISTGVVIYYRSSYS